jgi:hypothetical protein
MNEQLCADRVRGESSGSVVSDGGYVLAVTALLMLPILAFTAFAVDLGAWYAQGTKLQRSADSAALAGVVWLPDKAAAETAATNVLNANGYTGAFTASYPSTRRMNISVSETAPQYFSQLFVDGQNLHRDATAEFNLPVPLGSPSNAMGNNMAGAPSCYNPLASCASPQPQLWSAVQGPYTRKQDGDPYTTKCPGDTLSRSACDDASAPNGAKNDDYRKTGYTFAVDVPTSLVGSPITVQIYDAILREDQSRDPAELEDFTDDRISNPSGMSAEFPTQFELFDSDGSDLVVSTASALSMNGKCTSGPGRRVFTSTDANAVNAGTYKNKWYTLCTFTPTKSGIHPLVVKTSDISGISPDYGGGWNAFSLRATAGTSGTQPRVYSVDDMSIWSPNGNTSSGGNVTSRFYLAEIGQEHRGKKLIVDLYDPGDGSAGSTAFTMQFRRPPSGAPSAVPNDSGVNTSCKYNATKSSTIGPSTGTTSNNCTITTLNARSSTGIYNNGWLRVVMDIPTNYSCTSDCWWTVKYNFGNGTPSDRTVWQVTVVGDPVHLVE